MAVVFYFGNAFHNWPLTVSTVERLRSKSLYQTAANSLFFMFLRTLPPDLPKERYKKLRLFLLLFLCRTSSCQSIFS